MTNSGKTASLIHWLPCGHGEIVDSQHTVVIKRATLKIKYLTDKKKYCVMFTYDAHVAGRIELHFFELVGQRIKEVFTIKKDVEKGLGRKFTHEIDGFDFPLYKKGLIEGYYLVIEAQATEDGIKNHISETTEASIEKVMGEPAVRVKNQILSANGRKSVCHDMDGVRYSTQFDKDDSYNGCRICFNEANPGILFPIGKLKLFEEVIAEESNGNRVYKGTYDKSSVTVERIPKVHGHVTDQVIQILKESVQHPNIVGFVAKEETENFVFYVYERCECSLHDLISSVFHDKKSNEYKVRIPSFMHLKLWKPDNNSPSECLLKLLRGIVEGIVHFDEHGIIPNLNPRRIFICKAPSGITAKVLGMGISTSGQTTVGDSFNLGHLFCFCITAGYLPFNNKKVQDQLKWIPEASHLISRLQNTNPDSRPTAKEVCDDIFFWDAENRLSFIEDVSDCVDPDVCNAKAKILQLLNITDPQALRGKWVKSQKLDNVTNSKILKSLESLQGYSNWNTLIHPTLINNLERHRYYDYDSVCDLLRFIRNCSNHYKTLWQNSKRLLGGVRGLWRYFSSKFPKLLMEVYKVLENHFVNDELLIKYLLE